MHLSRRSHTRDGPLRQAAICPGSRHGTECLLRLHRRTDDGLLLAVRPHRRADRGSHLHTADGHRVAQTYSQRHSPCTPARHQSRHRTVHRLRGAEECWYSNLVGSDLHHAGQHARPSRTAEHLRHHSDSSPACKGSDRCPAHRYPRDHSHRHPPGHHQLCGHRLRTAIHKPHLLAV